MKTSPNSVWLQPMAPVHFPTGSAYRLREHRVGTTYAQQGVFLHRESTLPTTQRDREIGGMQNGETRRQSERRNEREAALLSRKVTD